MTVLQEAVLVYTTPLAELREAQQRAIDAHLAQTPSHQPQEALPAHLANNGPLERRNTVLNALLLSLHAPNQPPTLLHLIQALEPSLTNTDEEVRAGGIMLLAEVLARLPELPMSAQVVATLATFLQARVADRPCVREVVYAVWALLRHHAMKLQDTHIVVLFRALGEHAFPSTQAFPQLHRHRILHILQLLLVHHFSSMVAQGVAFVDACVGAADGEKDPRNLVLVFDVAQTILTRFPESVLTAPADAVVEKLFDITSCYFPITFNAPPDDPHGITGDGLRLALRQCLAGHVGMAQFTIPLIMEKLEAAGTPVKVDAWITLGACIDAYARADAGVDHVSRALPVLWHGLKRDLLSAGDVKVTTAVRAALRALTRMVCPDEISGFAVPQIARHWDLFMGPLIQDCLDELQVPDAKLARAHSAVLADVARASVNAMARVLAIAIPAIRERFFRGQASIFQQRALLDLVRSLVEAVALATTSDVASVAHAFQSLHAHPLDGSIGSQIVSMYAQLIKPVADVGDVVGAETRLAAVEAAVMLASIPRVPEDMLSEVDFRLISQATAEIALLGTGLDDTQRDRAMHAAQTLASHHPQIVLRIVVPLLARVVPGVVVAGRDGSHDESTFVASLALADSVRFLSVLAGASIPCFDTILPTLIHVLEPQLAGHLVDPTPRKGTALVASMLSSLPRIVSAPAVAAARADVCCDRLYPVVMTALIRATQSDMRANTGDAAMTIMDAAPRVLISERVGACAHVLRAIAGIASDVALSSLLDASVTAFVDGQVSLPDAEFAPFAIRPITPDRVAQLQLVPVFSAIVGCSRTSVPLVRAHDIVAALMPFIESHAAQGAAVAGPAVQAEQDAWVAAVHCLSTVLLNHAGQAEELVLEQTKRMASTLAQEEGDVSRRIIVLFWVVKAFFMRFMVPPAAQQLGQQCVALLHLRHRHMALLAATCFGNILGDADTMGVTTGMPLYKQRFFHMHAHQMISAVEEVRARRRAQVGQVRMDVDAGRDVECDADDVFLLALNAMLARVPDAVLDEHVPTMLVYMVQALSSKEPAVFAAALQCLVRVVTPRDEGKDVASAATGASVRQIASYAESILTACIELAVHAVAAPVRCDALRVLTALAWLPFDTVYPLSASVLERLDEALDDPKRVVRQLAVRCRNAWSCLSPTTIQ